MRHSQSNTATTDLREPSPLRPAAFRCRTRDWLDSLSSPNVTRLAIGHRWEGQADLTRRGGGRVDVMLSQHAESRGGVACLSEPERQRGIASARSVSDESRKAYVRPG